MSNVVPLPKTARKSQSAGNRFKFTRESLRRITAKMDEDGATNVSLRDSQEIGLVLRKQRSDWMAVMEKTIAGQTHRRTICKYDRDTFDVHFARAEASRIRTAIMSGEIAPHKQQVKKDATTRSLNSETLSDAIERHRRVSKDTRQTTIDTYRRQLFAALGAGTVMSSMTKETIQAWYTTSLEAGKSPTGLRSTFNAGRAVWNTWAEAFPDDKDRPARNPFTEFAGKRSKRLKASTSRTGAVPITKTAEFINAALTGMERGGRDAEAYAAVAFLALTGARASNAASLRREHVRSHALRIPADDMKGNAEHIFPISTVLRRVLDHQLNKHEGSILFSGPTSDGAVGDLRGVIGRICEAIGIDRITAHDLRRTYSVAATKALVPEVVRSMLLGHSLGDIGDKYAKPIRAELPQYAERVEAQLMTVAPDGEALSDTSWED